MRKPVPTMVTNWTGKPLSDRWSTARCASRYVGYRAIVSPRGGVGSICAPRPPTRKGPRFDMTPSSTMIRAARAPERGRTARPGSADDDGAAHREELVGPDVVHRADRHPHAAVRSRGSRDRQG